MTGLALFGEVNLSPPPKRPTESDFQFLNRAEGEPWQNLRDLLESWYCDFPDDTYDLRNRFRTPSRPQHVGAWWELYIFSLFRRLGYEITVHPNMPGTTKNPDFLVEQDSLEAIVECAVMLDEDRWTDSDGISWVLECIDSAKDANFRLGVDIKTEGSQRPKRASIIRAVENWLNSLDADAANEAWQQQPGKAPTTDLGITDWVINLVAYPIPTEKRAVGSHLIVRWPMKSGVLGHDDQLVKILSNKGSRYGQLDKPLVVAILAWPITAGEMSLTNALFGPLTVDVHRTSTDLHVAGVSRNVDGYWRPAPNPGGSRTSAVLLGEMLRPDRPFVTLPRVWVNPWATVPLQALPPLENTMLEGDHLVVEDASATTDEVFGYPPHWPHAPWPG
ncbi:hemin-binding protein [Mycobacterium paragordonae]|uniref:Hemin-binding protein n=1 Tax=Mycobacterium paragordonae TaxID=1389713 RepID=A0AAJ1S0C3_9MYCO|nr:hemin-binding protein [Mycobacterium paragordonae]MDP7735116.1 hemin-binding protein [Mycobacterium paragordonae]